MQQISYEVLNSLAESVSLTPSGDVADRDESGIVQGPGISPWRFLEAEALQVVGAAVNGS